MNITAFGPKNLFPDDVYVTKTPQSAITLRELFRRNLFQCSNRVKRFLTRHELPGGKFIELHGFANVTDQDLFFAVHYFARTRTKEVKIGNLSYPYCVLIPRKDLFTFLGLKVSSQGGYKSVIDRSLTRLQGLVVRHNIFISQVDNFSFFERCGYDETDKAYYFVISQTYASILSNSDDLKSFFMPDYFKLKDNLARILDPVMRVHFDADSSRVKSLRLETILKLMNKEEWIKAEGHSFRKLISSELIPAFGELESKGCFKFTLDGGNKYDLNAIWKVERLYDLKHLASKF